MLLKTCKNCKKELPLEDFFRQHNRKDGRMSYCKKCSTAKNQEWRAKNRERHNARNKAWIAKNPEKHRNSCYTWVQSNREKVVQITREWQKRNPEKASYYAMSYRARRIGAEGSHTIEEWKNLVISTGCKCLRCGKPGTWEKCKPDTLTEDHVIPLIHGGTDYIENIQPLCLNCNSQKNTKTVDYRQASSENAISAVNQQGSLSDPSETTCRAPVKKAG